MIGKEIDLRDDKSGSVLAGTTDVLKLNIKTVLSKKETEEFFSRLKIRNGDIIIKTDKETLVIEVKAGIRDLEPDGVRKIASVIRKLPPSYKVRGILIYMGEGEIKPRTIIEAKERGIIIITKRGINLLAKKVEFPTA